jgi:hypothetical protein
VREQSVELVLCDFVASSVFLINGMHYSVYLPAKEIYHSGTLEVNGR